MNLRLFSEITFTQVPNTTYPSRNKTFVFNFVNDVEIKSTWTNLTQTAKIIIPKKIYFRDSNNQLTTWDGQTIIGGVNPLILRGDKVSITLGYRYLQAEDTLTKNEVFTGYVSKVNPRQPLEIECEDNMWVLKNLSTPDKFYPNTDVETMISSMLKGTDFTVKTGAKVRQSIQTNLGDFRTYSETVGEVLQRLKDDYSIYSYFRGKELRCSGIVYYPEDQKKFYFKFQENIISDNLEYVRKDDVKIGIKASTTFTYTSGTTASGKPSKRKKHITVIVPPENANGDLRQLYFNPTGTTEAEITANLKTLATERLNRIYYEGYKGSFTTFGLPMVQHGNIVNIVDKIIPERNGDYLVKGVTTTFGMNGFRQEIELDIKTNGVDLTNGI